MHRWQHGSRRSAALITTVRSRAQALKRVFQAIRANATPPLPEHLILNSVQDAVIVVNRERRIQVWNRAAEAIYGWTAAEARGHNVQDLLLTRYPDHTDEEIGAILKQEGNWTGVVVQRHRDGQELMIESSVRVVYDAAGKYTGRVGVNRDVTARLRDEAARRITDTTTALLAASPDEQTMLSELAQLAVPALGDWCAIHLLTPSGDLWPVAVHHITPEYTAEIDFLARTYGFKRDVTFGVAQVLRTGKPELIPEITPAHLAAVLSDSEHPQQLHDMLSLSSAICVPIKRQETIFGVMSLVTTVSGRRYTAADLRSACDMAEHAGQAIAHMRLSRELQVAAERSDATLALLETLLTSAAIGIAFLDRNLRYTHLNEALATILGNSAAALLGQTIYTVLPDYVRALEVRLRAVLDEGTPFTNIEITFPAGTTVRPGTYLINYYPVRGTMKQITGVGVIVIDITERKRLHEQLTQSQKMEGLGRLAGGIAHDFNNLLTAILGNAELASDSLDAGAPEQDDLKQIIATASRAAALTRQLLTFARKQPLEPTTLNLNELITNVTTLLKRLIGEHIVLSTQLAPDVWTIRADSSQLEQVMINLAVNARDAMEAGGNLTIETANVELDAAYAKAHLNVQPGSYVRIAITDTGIGMSPEVQSRIFEPFFTTKDVGKGTGLGLATSYSIVQQHGGVIWVYSEVGHGTTFMIYLPRVATQAEPLSHAEAQGDLPRGSETVLVVEDEQAVRTFAARVLRAQGFRVLEASDGQQALTILATYLGHLDMVLTDVVMPGQAGPELVAQLHKRFPHLKVLYMSGYTEHAMIQWGEIEPTMALLHKPFTRARLLEKVCSVLDRPSEVPTET